MVEDDDVVVLQPGTTTSLDLNDRVHAKTAEEYNGIHGELSVDPLPTPRGTEQLKTEAGTRNVSSRPSPRSSSKASEHGATR